MDALVKLVAVTHEGIRHELDDSGQFCVVCGENADWLLESGAIGSF